MDRKQAGTWFLIALAAVALYLCYLIAKPFLNPIFAAIILAIIFYPVHIRIKSALRHPNLAAAVSTVLVMLIVTIPAISAGLAITRELSQLYGWLGQKSAAQGGLNPYLTHLLEAPVRVVGRYIDLSHVDLRSGLLGWVEQASKYLVALGAKAVSNVFSLILEAFVALFTLFFLFRDGPAIRQHSAAILPLTTGKAAILRRRINETIIASVHGGIAVGLAQGAMTGLAFWVLGLSSPVVWGLVAAMASLIPVVGTAIVWVPAAAFLLLSGHWIKALILFAWGAGAVAQIDAVLRPFVVGGRAKMHNLLIFFALLGGVKAFGIMGIFIGPVVISAIVVIVDMLRDSDASSPANEGHRTAVRIRK